MGGKPGLGKGLAALLPDLSEDESIVEVNLKELRPNPYQPRKQFDNDSLDSLAQSIKEHGVIQPLIVRKTIHGYEIIAGERRFRAGEKIHLETLPAVIREYDDKQMMEIALIENLQREDLNPIEIADAYQKLMKHFSLTQEQLSDRVGISRPHIANVLRLLQLPPELQENVSRGTLSMGHARTLLAIKDPSIQKKLAAKVEREDLSVRELEELVQKLNQTHSVKKPDKVSTAPRYKKYEDLLQEVLSTPVRIRQGRRKGKIEIEYYSEQELERLVDFLNQNQFID